MRSWRVVMVTLAGLGWSRSAAAQTNPVWSAETATWSPAGKGLESAVVLGDPDKAGSYSLAFRLAPGAWIPPHSHPTAKQVTVLSGALLMGMGGKLDTTAVHRIEAGKITIVRPNSVHFEGARERTVVLFSGDGPLVTNWVK